MSDWREKSIEDLCVRVTSGGTPSRKHPEYYSKSPEGIPWVKSQELVGSTIRATDEHISESGLRGSSAKLLPPDTILMAMYGANVGQLGYLGIDATVNQAICAMITNPDVTDPRFLYYALVEARQDLIGQAHGAAQQNLSQQLIKPFRLRVPSLLTQRRIGNVLGAIDDLIENNRRRAEVLEEMARTIYREWFVHFRFPGHENVELVDSYVGSIPDGWSVTTLADVSTNLDRHRRPLAKSDRSSRKGSYPYYGAAKLIDWIDDWIFDGEYLLFAEDGSVETRDGYPVLQLVEGKFWANNHTHILAGNRVSTRFLFLASERVPIRGYVTGAAQPKITQANLNRIPLTIGPCAVHDAFDERINPVFDAATLLRLQADRLASIRDKLLPKLVTGQIDLTGLDLGVLVEGAVA